MASLDEELLMDAANDAKAVEFISRQLPQELKEKFTEEDLYYFLDVIVEYYAESGVLEAEADEEGYVDIDMEALAEYMAKKPRKKASEISPQKICFSLHKQNPHTKNRLKKSNFRPKEQTVNFSKKERTCLLFFILYSQLTTLNNLLIFHEQKNQIF